VGLCVLLAAAGLAEALPRRAVAGAALGAAAGLVLGNNVRGVNRDVAVPVLAIAGGLIGNEMDHQARRREAERAERTERAPAPNRAAADAAPDPHPGVDLVKISILHSNGVRTDIPLLRVGGRFVGPQGETYDELPSAGALARRYGM